MSSHLMKAIQKVEETLFQIEVRVQDLEQQLLTPRQEPAKQPAGTMPKSCLNGAFEEVEQVSECVRSPFKKIEALHKEIKDSSKSVSAVSSNGLDLKRNSQKWHDEELPRWVLDQSPLSQTERVAKSEDPEYKKPFIDMEHTAAMSWKQAFKCNIVLWSFWLLYPLICYPLTQCDGAGFASAPFWILFMYSPCLLFAMRYELKILRRLLPAQMKHLGGFTMFGFAFPFLVWFVGCLGFSFLAHMDLATNGIFMARLIRTYQCSGESKVPRIWLQVVKDSSMPFLPRLSFISICIWAAMILQLLSSLRVSFPIKTLTEVDLGFCALWNNGMKAGQVHGIQTLSAQVLPSDALNSLATSGRMYLVTIRHPTYLHMVRGPRLQVGVHARRTWAVNIAKISFRCLFFTLLETSTLANLQASTIAISKAASKDKTTDVLTTVSVSLTLAMSVWTLTMYLMQMWKLCCDIWPYVHIREEAEDPDCTGLAKNKKRVITSIATFSSAAMLSAFLITYAALKLYNAVFVCHHGVWNLSGCVSPVGKDW